MQMQSFKLYFGIQMGILVLRDTDNSPWLYDTLAHAILL